MVSTVFKYLKKSHLSNRCRSVLQNKAVLSGVVDSVTVADRLRLSVLAGTGKSELLKIFLKQKLSPALFLAGIPGDVGGGVVMNAGVGEAMTPREFVEI